MTDSNKLKILILSSGLTKKYIAQKLGIDNSTFAKKLNNRSPFKGDEIFTLAKLLKIDSLKECESIFFKDFVDKTSTKEVK